MILVNQAMKGNKYTEIDTKLGPQSPRGDDKKSTKFNFGGFLKKIPLPVNKRVPEGAKDDAGRVVEGATDGERETPDMSLSPTAKNPLSDVPGSTSGGNSIAAQGNSNYTHERIPVGDASKPQQQRYATFTAKCISLENSEATSQIYLDEQCLDEQSIELLTHSPESLFAGNPELTSLLKVPQKIKMVKSRVNNDNTVTSIFESAETRGQVFEDYQHIDNLDVYKRELEEGDDVVEYLSETESDLNVNPNQEENINDYRTGGYHPVSKGEVYYSREFPQTEYIVLRKLGWGHFSTVWLAKSRYNPELNPSVEYKAPEDAVDHYVAIKFVKSSDNYMEAAQDEIKLLKALDKPLVHGKYLKEENMNFFNDYEINDENQPVGHPGFKHIMRLLDDFEVTGPNGKHICMVFEVLGENVLNLIFKSKTITKELKRNFKMTNEKKETKLDNNKNFKSFKSKLSLGLINNGKKDIHAIDTTGSLSNMAGVNNNSSDSLTRLIEVQKTYGGIPLTLVKQVVKQMFLAVDYMHHCGIIHTDLKPENILIEIKDINNVIKVLENEKITKFYTKYKNRKDSSISTNNMNSEKKGINKANPTNIVGRQDSVGYGTYRKSRNSVSCKCDSPVRTSKPLSSSINTNTMFKEMSFSDDGAHNARKRSVSKFNESGVSPTTTPILKPNINIEKINFDNDLISIKIADLGNATFSHYHFTNQIQTRQYRAPEILLKHKTWGASADIWSIGCILFELITGDYLFDPHNGNNFDKDEDHMAQIIELLGEFPSSKYLKNCDLATAFFKKDSENNYCLKNICKLKYWSLHDVLVQKYKFDGNDANVKLISDLILKCLTYDPEERYDCRSLVNHPWLNNDIDLAHFDLESLKRLPKNHNDIAGFSS